MINSENNLWSMLYADGDWDFRKGDQRKPC